MTKVPLASGRGWCASFSEGPPLKQEEDFATTSELHMRPAEWSSRTSHNLDLSDQGARSWARNGLNACTVIQTPYQGLISFCVQACSNLAAKDRKQKNIRWSGHTNPGQLALPFLAITHSLEKHFAARKEGGGNLMSAFGVADPTKFQLGEGPRVNPNRGNQGYLRAGLAPQLPTHFITVGLGRTWNEEEQALHSMVACSNSMRMHILHQGEPM